MSKDQAYLNANKNLSNNSSVETSNLKRYVTTPLNPLPYGPVGGYWGSATDGYPFDASLIVSSGESKMLKIVRVRAGSLIDALQFTWLIL